MKNTSMSKTIISALIIVLGIVVLIMGISGKYNYYGNYTYNESYGGDAYTGIQNAAADTSNNVKNIGYMLEEFFNLLFIFSGALIILLGSYLLVSNVIIKIEGTHTPSADISNETFRQDSVVKTSNNDVM